MSLTELPLDLPGRVFLSPMPFRPGDPLGETYRQYRAHAIHAVVMLASDEECLERTGRNLRHFYLTEGLQVIYLPIIDFGVPRRESLIAAIKQALACVNAGQNLVIHCYAGMGRTGLFSACLLRQALGLDGKAAITRVRQVIPGALETPDQIAFVMQNP